MTVFLIVVTDYQMTLPSQLILILILTLILMLMLMLMLMGMGIILMRTVMVVVCQMSMILRLNTTELRLLLGLQRPLSGSEKLPIKVVDLPWDSYVYI